jgi:deoxyribodipyrimidine photolyase-related protein
MQKTLRLILGDQLNIQHSWYQKADSNVTYVLMEMRQETDYTTHHIQKVAAFFAAMRAFADNLRDQGHKVEYIKLNDVKNTQSLTENLSKLIEAQKFNRFEYQLPDEYRLDQQLSLFVEKLNIPWETFDSEHFITTRSEVGEFFGKKNYLMETFYRQIRKKHGWLMDADQPVGGQWNFDKENRKSLPKGKKVVVPLVFENEVADILEMLHQHGVKTIGTIDGTMLLWPITRRQGLEILDFFFKKCFGDYGNFQDAMSKDQWSMYHSRISFALNVKLIGPKEVVERAIDFGRQNDVPLAAIEGFVRQIVGWREFIRGVYWAKMPEYASLNQLGHNRKLPDFYWTGKTKMACMEDSISQSLEKAYAHHIQRLMITGNFALLTMTHPDEVDQWYLGIYIDAIEWVELPNTRGMSQFADGGILATKPYVSSANYINKMSNYCSGCHYDFKKKIGEKACPFNSLYWNFLMVHEEQLSKNGRMNMMYAQLNKMNTEQKNEIREQAELYLDRVDTL